VVLYGIKFVLNFVIISQLVQNFKYTLPHTVEMN